MIALSLLIALGIPIHALEWSNTPCTVLLFYAFLMRVLSVGFMILSPHGTGAECYGARGACIQALLAALHDQGFHQNIDFSHRGYVGFCDSAIDGAAAYLLNADGRHWAVLKTNKRGSWVLCDSDEEKVIDDHSSYITEFVQRSKNHWVAPLIQGGRGKQQPYGAGPSLSVLGRAPPMTVAAILPEVNPTRQHAANLPAKTAKALHLLPTKTRTRPRK